MHKKHPGKLKVGLLIDGFETVSWVHHMLERVQTSDYAEIALVVINQSDQQEPETGWAAKFRRNRGQLIGKLVRKLVDVAYRRFAERGSTQPDAFQPMDLANLVSDVPQLCVEPLQTKFSDSLKDEDLAKVRSYELDVLFRAGFRILRGGILSAAKLGVWSFHHGDNRVNRGGPPGFWETMHNWPVTGSILQVLTEDLDNGKVLARSHSSTIQSSVLENRNNYYWKTSLMLDRKLREASRLGLDHFRSNVEAETSALEWYSEPLYRLPGTLRLAGLTLSKIWQKAHNRLERQFFRKQWILLFSFRKTFSSSFWRYRKLEPPADRFWADPHVAHHDGRYFLFFEEYLYQTRKGHISVMELARDGTHSEPKIAIEKNYHMSYPFVFRHEGAWFMIPETSSNETVELYQCSEFPHSWDFRMNLMEGVRVVDATLHHHDGKWWLFANRAEIDGVSSWDELFLYFADDFKTDAWTPHPLNPVLSDCRRSRPAGRIFRHNGRLYRPSQDCSNHYGYGLNLNEIVHLEPERYEERLISKAPPNWNRRFIGTHSFSHCDELHVIDALRMQQKPLAELFNARHGK